MKKNHIKPINGAVRPYAHIFVTKQVESMGYVSFTAEQMGKPEKNKENKIDKEQEDNDENTLDLTRTYSSLPQKNVQFVN